MSSLAAGIRQSRHSRANPAKVHDQIHHPVFLIWHCGILIGFTFYLPDKVIAAKEAEKEDAERNEISDEPVEKFSKTEINGKFKIMGEWDEKLSDPESEEFK